MTKQALKSKSNMTKDDIIRMVKGADDAVCFEEDEQAFYEHFANLVAAHEREACAVVCEELELPDWPEKVRQPLAAAIRARGQA